MRHYTPHFKGSSGIRDEKPKICQDMFLNFMNPLPNQAYLPILTIKINHSCTGKHTVRPMDDPRYTQKNVWQWLEFFWLHQPPWWFLIQSDVAKWALLDISTTHHLPRSCRLFVSLRKMVGVFMMSKNCQLWWWPSSTYGLFFPQLATINSRGLYNSGYEVRGTTMNLRFAICITYTLKIQNDPQISWGWDWIP